MISVDTVYQRVLAILNKENRGYMTPQEFNLMANQAQIEIFEQYFYDLNQFSRAGEINNEYANIVKNIKEKINLFNVDDKTLVYSINSFRLPSDLYRLGTVTYFDDNEVELVAKNELLYLLRSPLAQPTTQFPIYIRVGETIKVYPTAISQDINCSYIRKPLQANWTYFEVNNTPLYNPSADDHQNFELHSSEEPNIVNKILAYAGIVIKNPEIYQIAEAKENKKITQEKS